MSETIKVRVTWIVIGAGLAISLATYLWRGLEARVSTLEAQRAQDRETLLHVSDQVDAIGDKLGVPRRR